MVWDRVLEQVSNVACVRPIALLLFFCHCFTFFLIHFFTFSSFSFNITTTYTVYFFYPKFFIFFGLWLPNYQAFIEDLFPSLQIFTAADGHRKGITNWFRYPFVARYVRIYPQTWEQRPCVRFDLYGCNSGTFVTANLCIITSCLSVCFI